MVPAVSLAIERPEPIGMPSADLARLYRDHVDHVWRGLRRLGVHEASVDDAVQEVFVVVHRRFGEFEGRSALRTWIYGICINVARNYRRTQRRVHEELEEAAIEGTTLDPEQQAARASKVRLLDSLLQQLDDDKREVLVLAEIEGLSAPEIGELLDVKVPTVYTRLRAAKIQLRGLCGALSGSNEID